MTSTIFTIGYAGFSVHEFVDALSFHEVSAVIDVRSIPFSRYAPKYDAPVISKRLESRNICYRHLPREFGSRQQDRNFSNPKGYVDFEKFAESSQFRNGVDKILKGMNHDYIFALMCAEKDPINCHRAILVARAFHKLKKTVIHIMPDSEDITHKKLEDRLLEKYCPERNEEQIINSDWLSEAYRRCNAKIGWRLENNASVHDRIH